ncbi:MAG: zinc ribbon domain-containing protein [Syntrophomonadaceae bacterium]|nr:zinc ribbon domain-containing protein [Syntrophomonadaceae bacterium]
MNDFFGRLKHGVKETGKQAKVTLEVNRLKSQIATLQKELEKKYLRIGEAVYAAFTANDFSQTESLIAEYCQEITQMQEGIKSINVKIMELNNEKECVCGKGVPMDTRFCPFCGNKFELSSTPHSPNMVDEGKSCVCGNQVSLETRFCPECGHKFEGD